MSVCVCERQSEREMKTEERGVKETNKEKILRETNDIKTEWKLKS